MRKKCAGWSLLFICILTVSGRASEETIRLDAFAATVNSRVITVGDVRAAMEPRVRRLQLNYPEAELASRMERLFADTLTRLIERNLLIEEFQQRELTVPDSLIDAEIERLVTEQFKGDRSAFLEAMATERMTLDRYRERVRDELRARLMYQGEVTRRVVVTPADLREAYERNCSSYRVPARARLRVIELRGGDPSERRARAADLHTRLKQGESFAELAQRYSDGRHAEEGGDWGWRFIQDFNPVMAKALSTLSPGEISEPIEIEDRLFVVLLENREASRLKPLGEVLPDLERTVRRQEENRLREEMMERLRRKHAVRILVSDETE